MLCRATYKEDQIREKDLLTGRAEQRGGHGGDNTCKGLREQVTFDVTAVRRD